MLRLKLHFRNDEKEFDRNKFKPKSIFNLRNKEASIEIYLNSFEEKLEIEIPQNKYSNFSSGEHSTLYNLKNDKSIVMKVLIRVPELLSEIGMILLKRLRNNLEIKTA